MTCLDSNGIDMTLHRLTREEILEQTKNIMKMMEQDGNDPHDSEVIVLSSENGPGPTIVYGMEERDGKTVIMSTIDRILEMAPIMGSDRHALTIPEFADLLEKRTEEHAMVNSCSAVGKILAGIGGDGVKTKMCLFPVPENIEEINGFVDAFVKDRCQYAEHGQKCGTCCKVMSGAGCPILDEADKAVREEFGKKEEK